MQLLALLLGVVSGLNRLFALVFWWLVKVVRSTATDHSQWNHVRKNLPLSHGIFFLLNNLLGNLGYRRLREAIFANEHLRITGLARSISFQKRSFLLRALSQTHMLAGYILRFLGFRFFALLR